MEHGADAVADGGLTVRGLNSAVIRDASLTLRPGAGLMLSGPSGSGKTSLFRALTDLDPGTGDVRLNGTPREAMRPGDWRRQVAYVPAEPAWWRARAGDHLDEGARNAAGRLGLTARHFDKPVGALSTGERQRLALAMAFARGPAVLLLDEPTSALDEDNRDLVEAAIREALEKGAAVIMTSHDPHQIERLGFPVWHIEDGKLRPPDITP